MNYSKREWQTYHRQSPYIGKYFSQDYLRREILHQTDDEIVEQDKLIAAEIEAGLYVDPVAMQQLEVTDMT